MLKLRVRAYRSSRTLSPRHFRRSGTSTQINEKNKERTSGQSIVTCQMPASTQAKSIDARHSQFNFVKGNQTNYYVQDRPSQSPAQPSESEPHVRRPKRPNPAREAQSNPESPGPDPIVSSNPDGQSAPERREVHSEPPPVAPNPQPTVPPRMSFEVLRWRLTDTLERRDWYCGCSTSSAHCPRKSSRKRFQAHRYNILQPSDVICAFHSGPFLMNLMSSSFYVALQQSDPRGRQFIQCSKMIHGKQI